MKKIKEWIKREKFLSVCALIVVALALFMGVYSWIPIRYTTHWGVAEVVVYGIHDYEKMENESLDVKVYWIDPNGEKIKLNGVMTISRDGRALSDYTDEQKKNIAERYKKEGETIAICEYAWDSGSVKWEYQGKKYTELVFLKTYTFKYDFKNNKVIE